MQKISYFNEHLVVKTKKMWIHWKDNLADDSHPHPLWRNVSLTCQSTTSYCASDCWFDNLCKDEDTYVRNKRTFQSNGNLTTPHVRPCSRVATMQSRGSPFPISICYWKVNVPLLSPPTFSLQEPNNRGQKSPNRIEVPNARIDRELENRKGSCKQ